MINGEGTIFVLSSVFLLFLRAYPNSPVERIVVVVCDREALVQFSTASSENRLSRRYSVYSEYNKETVGLFRYMQGTSGSLRGQWAYNGLFH